MKWFAWGGEISSFREKSCLALCWECFFVCVWIIFPSLCLPDSFSSDMNNKVSGKEPLGVDPAGRPSSPHLATSPRCYCTHPESLFLSGEWKGGRTWLRVTPVPVSVKPIVITSWCLSTPHPHHSLSCIDPESFLLLFSLSAVPSLWSAVAGPFKPGSSGWIIVFQKWNDTFFVFRIFFFL